MTRDPGRIERTRQALERADLDAVVCTLPANVLLLSGYWPVVGTSVALADRDGRVLLLVPEDEQALTEQGWADGLYPFRPGSLGRLTDAEEAVSGPLAEAARLLSVRGGRVGYERGGAFEPASYAGLHLYGAAIVELLGRAFPRTALVAADELLARLRAVKTARERSRIRTACALAARAFEEGARQLRPGLRETEAAALFRTPLSTHGTGREGVTRADGFTFCMSGPNSAQAYGAYARSRDRRIARGDFVLVHCNSYADGYWTDITRTYCVGEPDPRQAALYAAIRAAATAAVGVIRPCVRGRAVDRAAREVLSERGFGDAFKHSTGHGVGFAAIDHNARPRLHPESDDELEAGMVFNVEPAVYFEGYGGVRHCDVVALTEGGAEVLTPFQDRPEEWALD
jgi:Xaa-Pro aminopeptidase